MVRRVVRHREAEVLAVLNHPHIGSIYDLENYDGLQFLVLELAEGETLAHPNFMVDPYRCGRRVFEPQLLAFSCGSAFLHLPGAVHEVGIVGRGSDAF